MEIFKNELLKSLDTYFNTLTKFGYVKYSDVYKLLVVLFLEEALNSLFSDFITESDYRSITNVLTCIYGSTCLLPYFKYREGTTLRPIVSPFVPRITEDTVLRNTEDSNLRAVE